MSQERITYSREDILKYKFYINPGYTIINHTHLNSLASRPTKAGLLRKKTKRGCRAGRKRTKFTIKRTQSDLRHFKSSGGQKLNTKQAYLPKVFYTNCRSLNQWKLDELKVLTEINKPNFICPTEKHGWIITNNQLLVFMAMLITLLTVKGVWAAEWQYWSPIN